MSKASMQNLLQQMVANLLINKPEEPVPFIVQFLQDAQGKGVPSLTKEERSELLALREEYKKLKNKKATKRPDQADSDSSDEEIISHANQKKSIQKKAQAHSSSDSGEDEEYLDEIKDPMNPMKQQAKIQMAQRARTSVSAEVFGKYHVKQAF